MELKDIEGKTIQKVRQINTQGDEDPGSLLLEFTDGTRCVIETTYYDGCLIGIFSCTEGGSL